MKTLVLFLGLLAFAATPALAQQDAFPISSAHIVNAPDVRSWPVTAAITSISVTPQNMRIDFTKRDGPNRWPDITPLGFTGPIEYTVWLFLQVDGQWVGSGFIQMWNGRDGVGDAPSDFQRNWYYSPRWNPLPGHGPIQPSDQIGIMVTSGNERDSGGPFSVQERSNVVLISGSDNGDYTFQVAPAPVPVPVPVPSPIPPVPVPVPTPVPAPVPAPQPPLNLDLGPVLAKLDQIIEVEKDTNAQVVSMNRTVAQTLGAFMTFVGKYIAPAVTAYIAAKKLG